MRSRTLREGSVGLLILAGLGLFIGLGLWIRGLNFSRSYTFLIEFVDAGGIQPGGPVRYRGVLVGQITDVRPGLNLAEVEVEISPPSVVIPRNSLIYPNQTGLIGEAGIDILPPAQEVLAAGSFDPLAEECDRTLVICDGDRISGEKGVTFNELIRATIQLTNILNNPELFENINTLTRNSSDAAAGVTRLTAEVTELAESVQAELSTLSRSANATTLAVGRTASELSVTANEVNRLIAANQGSLVSTLNNVTQTSNDIRVIVNRLMPLVEEQGVIADLQLLSTSAALAADNAAQASVSLRALTDSLGSADNLLLLQETLDSARATFQNAQKITADLDELTGDPTLRRGLRDLIRGFSRLVSSTEQLQQQTQVAEALSPAASALQLAEDLVDADLPSDSNPAAPAAAEAAGSAPLSPTVPTSLPEALGGTPARPPQTAEDPRDRPNRLN
ncbi:MAG: MCE family protein [Kaiparowitsia implicata GSE-PSE-MK54-09C]|nr:MCE family protein [Kaiparowitsia implicata GSE-PSE-MK54-09C]